MGSESSGPSHWALRLSQRVDEWERDLSAGSQRIVTGATFLLGSSGIVASLAGTLVRGPLVWLTVAGALLLLGSIGAGLFALISPQQKWSYEHLGAVIGSDWDTEPEAIDLAIVRARIDGLSIRERQQSRALNAIRIGMVAFVAAILLIATGQMASTLGITVERPTHVYICSDPTCST